MTDVVSETTSLLPSRLVTGYEAFLSGRFGHEQQRFRELAERGQNPSIMIVGCCDSRVSPEVIFDAGPGEIFVVRNVANLIPPYGPNEDLHGTSAALEFAVMGLRVEHIVIMGHAQCGGVKAFAQQEADPYTRPLSAGDFISRWMSLIEPAARDLPGPGDQATPEYIEKLAHRAVMQSLTNLRTFPWVRTLEERGLLNLHGVYFGVADGRLEVLNTATGEFEAVAAEEHAAALRTPRF
jgi:carbonic anhydrase